MRTRRIQISEQGFTLIEAMIVLVLLGVVAAIAVPSLERSATQAEVRRAASDLAATINTARAYAVSRREMIPVVADGGDAANEWGNPGWTLQLPAGVDGDQVFETPEKITVDEVSAGVGAFALGPDGRVYNAAGTAVIAQLSFDICPVVAAGITGRKLEINVFGKVRVTNKEDC